MFTQLATFHQPLMYVESVTSTKKKCFGNYQRCFGNNSDRQTYSSDTHIRMTETFNYYKVVERSGSRIGMDPVPD